MEPYQLLYISIDVNDLNHALQCYICLLLLVNCISDILWSQCGVVFTRIELIVVPGQTDILPVDNGKSAVF